MLEIERVSWLKARYAIRLEGHSGVWERQRLKETMSGDVDGERYDVQRDGRKRFVLMHFDGVLARADAGGRRLWTISAGDSSYELGRRFALRSEMELRRDGARLGGFAGRGRRAPRFSASCRPSSRRPSRCSSGSWF
ncbi:MAG: hypothetical protein M3065_13995 [Actinomycetota bacterium]|nr:hypothetical protein [Actinomycetota bacterium]